ncbi:hypothetical protein DFH08DRAFT_800449 [Mycena albidolilacea]|uniref:Uncharacterized protein n=1 Tax=Mycena albidolilacea TaxID=1033008 RepID=A0AAD7AK41_9AGAR|nr:hypothetical protein DFH08DRAFT_800449 [Mycena albidolilacea]
MFSGKWRHHAATSNWWPAGSHRGIHKHSLKALYTPTYSITLVFKCDNRQPRRPSTFFLTVFLVVCRLVQLKNIVKTIGELRIYDIGDCGWPSPRTGGGMGAQCIWHTEGTYRTTGVNGQITGMGSQTSAYPSRYQIRVV